MSICFGNRFVAATLVGLLLSACSTTTEGPKRICPQVAILRELDTVFDYGLEAQDPVNLVANATLNRVDGACKYVQPKKEGKEGKTGVDIDFYLNMTGYKGPRLGGSQVSFPYFVGLLDPQKKVLSKNIMTATFVFENDPKQADVVEDLHVFIPTERNADASHYQVIVGFQLTEEQVKALRKKANK